MSDVEYWTKRVAELEEQSAKAEDFLNDQKNLSINALPGVRNLVAID